MDDGTYNQPLTQVIQTAKLFIKFVEQLNRSCLEKKRGNNKIEKKPVSQENDSSLMKGSDPKKKVKMDVRPKDVPQPTAKANALVQQQPSRLDQHKEEAAKKAAHLYSFKDQKPIDLRLPNMDNKEVMPMGSFGNLPAYNFFGHPHNPLFPEGMPPGVPFYHQSIDPLTYFNFQNKQVFPSYFIQPGLSPDKMHYFSLPIFNHQKNFMVPPVQPDPKLMHKPQVPRERKLFKRASYHVAIAYNIHLQKLNKKSPGGSVDPNELDPTYRARSLKEQKGGERPGNFSVTRQPLREADNVRARIAAEQQQEGPPETTTEAFPAEPKPVPAPEVIDLTGDPAPDASFEPPTLAAAEPPQAQPATEEPVPQNQA